MPAYPAMLGVVVVALVPADMERESSSWRLCQQTWSGTNSISNGSE
jgi:hypothetical protein